MKLRVRLHAGTTSVHIESSCSFGDFKSTLAQTFGLEQGSFEVSLNGRDVLQGSEETPLSQFDIVSGDLIRILTQNNQQEQSSKCDARKSTNTQTQNKSKALSTSSSSHQGKMSSNEKPLSSRQTDEQDMDCARGTSECSNEPSAISENVLARISEPMLCREATEMTIPLRLRQLLNRWQPTTQCEMLCIALHVLILETGFVAKLTKEEQNAPNQPQAQAEQKETVEDDTSAMPLNWKSSSAAYKITYTHPLCEGAECSLAWVPLGSVLMVHALTTNQTHFQLKLNSSDFVVKSAYNTRDGCVPYRQLASLSRQFKDCIAHPLLEAVRAELGLAPLHGLMALVPEIQLRILSILDAKSLLKMTEVCSYFQSMASDTSLWRQLVLKQFGGAMTDSNTNWKELYRQKYQTQKEREQAQSRMTYIYPPLVPPHHGMVPPLPDPMHPMYPPGYRGGDYDLDPFVGGIPMFPGGRRGRLPNAAPFPGARHDPIFPDGNFRPGRGGGMRDMDGRSGRNGGGRNRMFPGGGFGF